MQTEINSESCCTEDNLKSSSLEVIEKNKFSDIELKMDDQNYETSENIVQSGTSSFVPETSATLEKVRIKSRSLSLKESGTKSNVQRTRRKKCESESTVFSSTDDEGFEDKIIQFRERDLEKVIGQCVDRLIRESILTAVKTVRVDNLYEDVIKSLSRSTSESSESSGGLETVPQKLYTDSVAEYAVVHKFEEEKSEDEESCESDNSKQQRDSSESSDQLQSNIRNEKYCEEIEEDSTFTESHLKSMDKMKDLKASEIDDGLNSAIQIETDPTKLLKKYESQNQNGNILTNVKISGSDKLDALVESDGITTKDKELHENDGWEQTKRDEVCQEKIVPTENTDVTETAEGSLNFSQLATDHAPQIEGLKDGDHSDERDDSKIKIKSMKDISAEAHHTDIEESVSLHSMTSESSYENIKVDEKFKKDIHDSFKPQLGGLIGEKPSAEGDLMAMSGDDFSHLLASENTAEESWTRASDLGENLPEQKPAEENKVNWKVGYLHVKLPHKSRHNGLKVWKKRCVAIQPDKFTSDDSDPCLVLSVYSSATKKHSASFWKSISCQKAVIYRSSSRTHRYAFTISDDMKVVVHLAAVSEADAQEWMTAVRSILWPPSPVIQLEKMLNGREFEISIIDNEFSYRAGLLGMYGYLTITPKKLILVHPQQGFVIQEWYLNTIDKFQLIPQARIEDVNKVLSMTTCSDSSTGRGDLLLFCREAVALLQAVQQVLSHHRKELGGGPVADAEDYYKVPPSQVKSLLDIPNFTFDKPLTSGETDEPTSDVPREYSRDSSRNVTDDVLNCSATSFRIGRGLFTGKSSDSELSDAYTPPRSPEVKTRGTGSSGRCVNTE